MKTFTNDYKNAIKQFGKQIDSKITYGLVTLGAEDINSVSVYTESSLLKSVMKQLDIDSNTEIPIGTEINYQFGVYVNSAYEYLDMGNYIVKEVEKQEDTNSYKMTCYDKMLYAMKDYQDIGATYPITIRNYINTICSYLGLTFANANDTFANYDRVIANELYLDGDGNSIGYTFRDVLDELSQVTASNICINEDDELEIRYITDTNDTIDKYYLKDVNVNFGEKYGPINSIVLSRADESDNVYLRDDASIALNGLCELKIKDNQIMNLNDRADYLSDILTQLDGLEYYLNDYKSTGITYYDVCDRYNVQIDNNTYSCVMFNDEINVTQGLEENIHTDIPETGETEYQYASTDDRTRNQAYIIAKKNTAEIEALASKVVDLSNTITGTGSITLENAYEGTLHRLEIVGNIQKLTPTTTLTPSTTLIPLDTMLDVDGTKYLLDIDYLNYTSVNEHDTFIYEDGKCWIERADGTIDNREDITIQVSSSSVISMEHYSNVMFKCIYLIQNDYTDTFTNSLDLVSRINMSPEKIEIDSNKISLQGKTIDLTSDTININSKYFKVDSEGHLTATSATLNGSITNYSSTTGKKAIEIKNANVNFYDFKGSGDMVGKLSSTRAGDLTGFSLYCITGSKLFLGYQDDGSTSIHSIITFDTNDTSKTPWIKNTANGTLFSNAGGITVEHGLIKNWNLNTASTIFNIGSTWFTFKDGLLVDVS